MIVMQTAPMRRCAAAAPAGEQLYGLRFPGNDDAPTSPFIAFQFFNPQNDGLPLWGPNGQGTTWIWETTPEQQDGFYVAFWWSQADGNFDGGNGYYGCHPYPPGGSSSPTHYWEIAIAADDKLLNRNGQQVLVVKGVKYTQALRVERISANEKRLIFYYDLPNVDNDHVIEWTETNPGYGESVPPTPAVTFGDSPWYATFQHERFSGLLQRVKIFNILLSEANTLSEAADMSQTSNQNIWWGKNNYDSVDDLTCDYGTGRTFAWADGSNKATLEAL